MDDWLPAFRIDDINGGTVERFLRAVHPEGRHVEYKAVGRNTTDKVVKTICSMANSYGGVILVGVPEGRENRPDLEQLKNAAGATEDVRQAIERPLADRVEPPIDPQMKFVSALGARILIIQVRPSQDRPVLCSGVAYYRHGEQDIPMPREMVRAAFSDSGSAQVPAHPALASLHPHSVPSKIAEISRGEPELLLRCAVGVPAWTDDQARIVTGSETQGALMAVASASLDELIHAYGLHYGADASTAFIATEPTGPYVVSVARAEHRQRQSRAAVHARLVFGPPET